MIETEQQLKKLMERASTKDAVGLDTEFVWERTYFPRLGLIQLALSEEDCFLIDPLVINDLSPLGDLLADKNVVKIFHDGTQDLAILRKATGADPKNIFDTRMAAGFTGFLSTLSLLSLVEKLLNISLNKSQTRTNWLKRPLSQKQMKYGLDDVRYLPEVRRLLLDHVQPQAEKWLKEELLLFDTSDHYMGIGDTERYIKVRGAKRLNRTGLAILRGLGDWREQEARIRNKPRGHIIRDEVLLHIAYQQLGDANALHQCEGISDKSIARYGSSLMQIVTEILEQNDNTYPDLLRNGRLTKTEEISVQKLQSFISQHCEEYGVDPALLGNKAELKALVKQTTVSMRQNEGWRKEVLAEFKQA